MRYLALASDYDDTLAQDGRINDKTLEALEQLVRSGRKLILVTGRELTDLESLFPRLDLCARVVAENGALLYDPATKERRVLAQRPPEDFIGALRARGVDLHVGEVIVSTFRPQESQVLEAIQDLGLELQIIFNKDAVMVLPSGVDKLTGLSAAVDELGLSLHNAVGIGDAENDHAFVEGCECSVAVANAIPSLKMKAAMVTAGSRGEGVAEVVAGMLENDLAEAPGAQTCHLIPVGSAGADEIQLAAYGRSILVCGESGSGKSSLVIGLLERISDQNYQICLVDPEGDYENLSGFRTVGTEKHPPSLSEVKQTLEESRGGIIVNLVGIAAADRPQHFASLIATLQETRLRTGRPHWIIIDEAHHVLPSEWGFTSAELSDAFSNVLLITVHPEHVSRTVLNKMNTVLAVGRAPRKYLDEFAQVNGAAAPTFSEEDLERGQCLVWFVDEGRIYAPVQTIPSRIQHDRHKRKYAEGRLEEERIFHFRGPEGRMNLRAHNLSIFILLAEGVDADTWNFHLRRGEYSGWLRHGLKDSHLADAVANIEKDRSLEDRETRSRIVAAIQQKYTAPA